MNAKTRLAVFGTALVLSSVGLVAPALPAGKGTPTPSAKKKATPAAFVPFADAAHDYPEGLDLVTQVSSGRVLERITKASGSYVVRDGKLYAAMVKVGGGVALVAEDETFYYVEVKPVRKPEEASKAAQAKRADSPELVLAIAAEADEITLPRSKKTLRLEEHSAGLPTVGMWRQNFALADLDGDGRPEIVAPTPRLSGIPLPVYRWDAKANAWRALSLAFENAVAFGYGGMDVADMDGDGKPDLLMNQHGEGPVIGYGLGGLKFRWERRGLSRFGSGQAIAAADVDKDGRLDVVSISDQSEAVKVEEAERVSGRVVRDAPLPDGYVPGIDTRSFLNRNGEFKDVSQGMEGSCFGEALAVQDKPSDGGPAFVVTSCAYLGNNHVIRSWRANGGWEVSGRKVTELFGYHSGVAMGTYRGKPAAYVTIVKVGPQRFPKLQATGVTVYYRDGAEWKSKRIVKHLQSPPTESPAIAVADLDGDGLDDVAWADNEARRLRVAFQRPDGEFEEMDPATLPAFVNRATCLRVADLNGDGRKDLVLMYSYQTTDPTREGGLRAFWNAR